MKHRPPRSSFLLFVGLALGASFAACTGTSSDPPVELDPPDPAEEARARFWEVFTTENLAEAAAVTSELEQVYRDDPEHPNNTLLLGLAHLWQLAEMERFPDADPARIQEHAFGALDYVSQAQELTPNDGRIFGWLAPVGLGIAAATGDEALAAEAWALFDVGVENYPEFNLLPRSLENGVAPLGSEAFQQAVDDLWRTVELCTGLEAERSVADVDRMIAAFGAGGALPACGNTPRAAHNTEGFLLYFGDLVTKEGDPELARAVYGAAHRIPSYDDWPYAHVLEEREISASDRADAYGDDDPENDPRLVSQEPYNCSYCHAAARHEPRPG